MSTGTATTPVDQQFLEEFGAGCQVAIFDPKTKGDRLVGNIEKVEIVGKGEDQRVLFHFSYVFETVAGTSASPETGQRMHHEFLLDLAVIVREETSARVLSKSENAGEKFLLFSKPDDIGYVTRGK